MRLFVPSTQSHSNSSKCITYTHHLYHKFSRSLLHKPLTLSQLHQFLAHTITTNLFSNPFISSKLLLSFSSPSNPSFARSLFPQIPNPNLHAWNFMFKLYANSSSPQESIFLYNNMRNKNTLPDNYTFPFVLKCCSRLMCVEKGQELHLMSLKLGFEFDVFVQNSLISMYSTCGMVQVARKVFDFLPVLVRDVVSWNSMTSGYLQRALYREALTVFGDMLRVNNGVRPNEVTAVSGLAACARIRELSLGKRIHGFSIRNEFEFDVYLGSSLIDMYAKCGHADDARKVFDGMPERNVVCWTSMIAGYVQSGLFKEAFGLFIEMQIAGVRADEATVACVISACGHLGALEQGRWVHTYCERNEIEMNLTVRNALIDMYSKCGDIDKALEIFNASVQKDVFSWTVMISGLAINGKSDQALELFSHMEFSSGVKPNEVTFLGVLTACSHCGLVDKGFYYFESMTKSYNLIPRIEHYGCVIDLLGRANRLTEAKKFLMAMPLEPDVITWRSLLFSSRTNGNLEMAEFAAKKILELEPSECSVHVLLSNAYAAASMWSDVKRVRKGMESNGIRKQPGCSFVEINGVVHEFYVADTSHPHNDKIYETLLGINTLLQFKGYVLSCDQFEGD